MTHDQPDSGLSHLTELKNRYDAVMRNFGESDEQEKDQSERLLSAVTEIGEWLGHQRQITEQYRQRANRLSDENEQLRFMLHSLLVGIESRNRGTMTKAMLEVESRLSMLTQATKEDSMVRLPGAAKAGGEGDQAALSGAKSKPSEAEESDDEGLDIPDSAFGEGGKGASSETSEYAPFPVDSDTVRKPPPFPHADPDAPKS